MGYLTYVNVVQMNNEKMVIAKRMPSLHPFCQVPPVNFEIIAFFISNSSGSFSIAPSDVVHYILHQCDYSMSQGNCHMMPQAPFSSHI